ncbi:MAG: uracil phosphoribosyltransferase [Clostridiales bacterium]|nr:uracil phosphoribosyltransferase [Clostridiales bacterium]
MGELFIIDHPLIVHKLSIMRDKETGTKDFKELLNEISMLMAYEITRDLPLENKEIETPLCKMTAKKISGKKLAIVPILRAGLGMVDGITKLVPVAKVGHIGLYRDPVTHEPVEYYCKMPEDIEKRIVIVLDPMLATGGSAIDAVTMLKSKGCNNIKMMNLVVAPEGVKRFHEVHPDVDIYTAALDDCLNEHDYIVPGLGDAGDRIFGTK